MKLAAFDVETRGTDVGYGLQPWRVRTGEAWLTMAAIATDAGASGWKKPNVEQLRGFLQRMTKTKTRIVGWNTPFDMGWLLAMGLRDEVYACDWLDGMLVWKHLTATPVWTLLAPKSYSLKACVAQYLPALAGYEKDINFETDDPEELERLFTYNKLDATYTLALTRELWKQLTPAQQRCVLIEAATLPMVAEAYVEGVAGNRIKATALSLDLENTAKVELVKLQINTTEAVDPKVLASPTQLRKLLFEDWKLPIRKVTVKGAASTDRDALSQLAEFDDRAAMLNNYREAMNNRTKFAEGMIASLDYNGDGMVRPNPRMYGTYTGRMSYGSKILRGKDERPTGVPLHQWKRGYAYRDLIEAPEGYDLLEFDFAGQEYRWMAVLSRDPTMLEMCEPGHDGHSYLGAKVARRDYTEFMVSVSQGDPLTKDQRQLGKVGNLSCIAASQPVLTDRGYVRIQDVALDDLVWDGAAWVSHTGVVYQGVKDVITYGGVTGTPDHKVLVGQRWVHLQRAAQMGWKIQPALGERWADKSRSAVRIVGGIIRRAFHPVRSAILSSALPVRVREGREPAVCGSGPLARLSELCQQADASQERAAGSRYPRAEAPAETSQLDALAVPQSQRSVIQELRGAWHRVSVCVYQGGRGVYTVGVAYGLLRWTGHRSHRQQRALRTRQPEATQPQTEHSKQATYDITNAGPRARFVVGPSVVSNCQYRTGASTLERVARVQFGVTLSQAEARAIHGTYRVTYPNVPRYWKKQIEFAKTKGYVETVAGRRVQLGIGGSPVPDMQWGYESTAINSPIQGAGADQKYLALMAMKDYLPSVGGRFYLELHDGIFAIVPKQHSERARVELKQLLSNLPYKKAWGIDLPIMFPVDSKIGPSWGQLKEIV